MGVCMAACAKASKDSNELVASQKKEILKQLDEESKINQKTSTELEALKEKDTNIQDPENISNKSESQKAVSHDKNREDTQGSLQKEKPTSIKSLPKILPGPNNLIGKGKTEKDNDLINSTINAN